MQKLKVNDEVVVIAGKERGKTGKILKLNEKTNRVVVSGLNMVKKAIRPSQGDPTGGITDIEASLHVSNVSLISPKTKKPTKVKIVVKGDKRVRVAKKCGTELDK